MKSVIASLIAVAGVASAATADVSSSMSFTLYADGAAVGSNSVVFNRGTGIHLVEVVASFTYTGTAQPVGFASAVFQPTVSNFRAGGHNDVALGYANGGAGSNTSTPSGVVADAPGQYGRMSPWGRTSFTTVNAIFNHLHAGGAAGAPAGSWLRIAQRTATSWIGAAGNTTGGQGINVAQLSNVGRTTSDPAFNPNLVDVRVFRWGMQIDTGADAASSERDLLIDAPANGFGNFNSTTGEREVRWFANLNENTGSVVGTALVTPGLIRIVPTPASLALLGLGGLCVARRRR